MDRQDACPTEYGSLKTPHGTKRVLVVGTTSDYVKELLRRHPGRAIFLTGASERVAAAEPPPGETDEVLCDLADAEGAELALAGHLGRFGLTLAGVAAFDCESLALASHLARRWSLPFPSFEAVAACRDKQACKLAWHAAGLPCPRAALVSDEADALAFWESAGRDAVLKPLTGSGSELTFRVCTRAEVRDAVALLRQRLASHANARMYDAPETPPPDSTGLPPSEAPNPRRTFAIEEFASGEEYSCDFLADGGSAQIVRLARKIPARDQPFGTTLAYEVPAPPPPGLDMRTLAKQAAAAARALGMERVFGMLDFIVRGGEAAMIEMAPRPGGDCLPPLVRMSMGLDPLGLALDFAEGRVPPLPPARQIRKMVGVRLFATCAGTLARVDFSAAQNDPRVAEFRASRRPGHRVVLPPDDYDSRILGHVLFRPTPGRDLEEECLELAGLVGIDVR